MTTLNDPNPLESLPRSKHDIHYRAGGTSYEVETELTDADLTREDIYDTFDDPSIDKSRLKELAFLLGRSDAFRFITDQSTGHLPKHWGFLDKSFEILLENATHIYHESHHMVDANTWTEYLRGWCFALQFCLDDDQKPWESTDYTLPPRE